MNVLENIDNFGSEDAEKDTRLLDFFYETPVLERLEDYTKNLVIGRKGTGKTALYKYLSNKYNDNVVELFFTSYPWKLHDKFKNNIVSERESYRNSWEFLFYIEFFKKLILHLNDIQNKKIKKSLKKISKWLKKNWGSTHFNFKEVLTPKKTKYLWSFAPQVLGCSLGSISRDIENSDNVGNTISEYNKKFDIIMNEIFPYINKPIILLFDELDLAYSSDDDNYTTRLIGILLALYSFHGKYEKKFRVYVFLRNDIFNSLQFQDKRKLKDNITLFLDWDAQNIESDLSLKQVAANRIKVCTGQSSNNFQRNWEHIFENSYIGKKQLLWNFFIERSFIRPRDLIKFLNLALAKAKLRLKNKPESIDKIINDDIHGIRDEYSRYLFDELTDEIHSKYKDFNNYLEILRDIHHVKFTKEQFHESYKKITNRLSLPEETVVLERLYEFGIIGFYKPGGKGKGGATYTFQFSSEYQNMNVVAEKYMIHYGFKEFLELIE